MDPTEATPSTGTAAQPEPSPQPRASKYASVLFQQKEVYDIGPFRFPVYETLTPTESRAYGEYQKAAAAKQLKSVTFARTKAKELGLKTREVLNALRDPNNELHDDLIYDNVEQFNKLQDESDLTQERNVFIMTVMQSRGSVKLPPEGEYIKTKDWTLEDTLGLLSVADDIFEFINWEISGWPPTTTENTEEVTTAPLEIQQPTSITTD